MRDIFRHSRILVIGGTGSLGKVLCKRILSGERGIVDSLTVLSRDEAKQHDMRIAFGDCRHTQINFRIGDVRSYEDVRSAMSGQNIVINAAALKQVPSCEYHPGQAILTNCVGPMNIVRAANEMCSPDEPQIVIGVSTDKACEPVNAMGMTKALQERIMVAANLENTLSKFICVRYGNVLASRGSVIPLFKTQIAMGGPVTITRPDMTRFLLSLNQAVDTIFTAITSGEAGDTFVPMAPAATIGNVAKAMIGDCKIDILETGARPGEKIHETLVSEAEAQRTVRHGACLTIRPMLPEVQGHNCQVPPHGKPYRSCDDVLNYEQTAMLLRLHRLIDSSIPMTYGEPLA